MDGSVRFSCLCTRPSFRESSGQQAGLLLPWVSLLQLLDLRTNAAADAKILRNRRFSFTESEVTYRIRPIGLLQIIGAIRGQS